MKNILKITMVAAFSLFAGYNFYQSNVETKETPDIVLANVEALAAGEGLGNRTCYKNVQEAPSGNSLAVWQRDCRTCTEKWLVLADGQSTCF